MQIRLALPKGQLLKETAEFLMNSGVELAGYSESSRSYRPTCPRIPGLVSKVFQERDIPIQVAVGNYDVGICGLDWTEELLVRYPQSSIIKLGELHYGFRDLVVCQSTFRRALDFEDLRRSNDAIQIASEYPNLAEVLALKERFRRYKIFPVWGSAAAYPPENSDLVLIPVTDRGGLSSFGLAPLATMLTSQAIVVVNKNSWERKNLGDLLDLLCEPVPSSGIKAPASARKKEKPGTAAPVRFLTAESVRLALPDGHQQQPTAELLKRAGIDVREYLERNVRPSLGLEGVTAKVIRPQDMPLQVANGNFDVAVTGRDWLQDHLSRFPGSPVEELLPLNIGQVRIVAVVHGEMGVERVGQLASLLESGKLATLRVASEYFNLADKYARENRLSPYRVIPTWGATEAFLPDDADLLVENTQTGRTLAEHNLKVIGTLFESTACLIGNKTSRSDGMKVERIQGLVDMLRRAVV